ncbi:SGNH/GDSL hydrolase family protein [Yimella sp. cx-573]|nr:SGNH/GDSL hydrolase family protein [Yimella sp. cx-573]
MKTWERYVAIGDSYTEGMVDEHPEQPDVFVGWADRLAAQLAATNAADNKPFGYANLAVRGRLLADVAGPQLQQALELQPDLVSLVGGGNDILRPKADLDAIADSLEEAVATVRATGADVLLSTFADPVGAAVLRRLRGRVAAHNANVWGIAQRQGAMVLDIWSLRSLRDARMWGTDRIHLSTQGHQRVAAQAYWTLGDRETTEREWAQPLPPAPALRRREAIAGHASWAKEYAGPWVQRRLKGRSSGDEISPKRPAVAPVDLEVE